MRLLYFLNGIPIHRIFSIEEAILRLKAEDNAPDTLMLYVMRPSAVSIGYFQRIKDTVNLEVARSLGIRVVRRITGGGAVYHDGNGEVTYGLIKLARGLLIDLMKTYCEGIAEAVRCIGLEAELKPINDIVVHGRKVSGSAGTIFKGALLQHGTLLYNTDLEIVERLLKVPKEKLRIHGVKSIKARITTLSIELGRTVSKEEVAEALTKGFSKILNVKFFKGELSEKENKLAEKIETKYKSDSWNFRR